MPYEEDSVESYRHGAYCCRSGLDDRPGGGERQAAERDDRGGGQEGFSQQIERELVCIRTGSSLSSERTV